MQDVHEFVSELFASAVELATSKKYLQPGGASLGIAFSGDYGLAMASASIFAPSAFYYASIKRSVDLNFEIVKLGDSDYGGSGLLGDRFADCYDCVCQCCADNMPDNREEERTLIFHSAFDWLIANLNQRSVADLSELQKQLVGACHQKSSARVWDAYCTLLESTRR